MLSGRVERSGHGGDRVGPVGVSGRLQYVRVNKDAVQYRSRVCGERRE
jgi:hypothetical protein